MAGGRGERLRPLTDKVPKPMLPLGDKPIIEHNIDRLILFGINHITISVNYLADQIVDYFGDGTAKGITIDYIQEKNPLGTIGCLSLMEDFESNDILLMNSDIFTSIDFEDFFIEFVDNHADMATASIPYTVDIPYAILGLEDNRIVSFREKPKNTHYANAGIYLLKHDLIHRIPKNQFFNTTDFMQSLIDSGFKLIHNPITGFWIDIGRHDDYEKAKEVIKHL
jgi:NDP-sugar pyrophosphorylase family protein